MGHETETFRNNLLKIISGGQTGVDRGALDAALEVGVECGGWCPAGRLAEDGEIPEQYPVVEVANAGYAERTAQNVADSDGTLIIANGEPIGGTRETVEHCIEMRKPYLIIDSTQVGIDEAIAQALEFVTDLSFRAAQTARNLTNVRLRSDPRRDPSVRAGLAFSLGMTVLNVAGPRASQWPQGRGIAYQIVSAILHRFSGQNDAN